MDWQQIIALLIVAATVAVFVFATIRNRSLKSSHCACTGCGSGSARSPRVHFTSVTDLSSPLVTKKK